MDLFFVEREQKRLIIFCMNIRLVRKNINFQSDMHKVLVTQDVVGNKVVSAYNLFCNKN